jgi:hypothetical protein
MKEGGDGGIEGQWGQKGVRWNARVAEAITVLSHQILT